MSTGELLIAAALALLLVGCIVDWVVIRPRLRRDGYCTSCIYPIDECSCNERWP